MPKTVDPQVFESTAGQVAAERARPGIAPDQHVTITIEPASWLAEVRRFTRPRAIAEGWSDADIDRIIDEERDAVQPRFGWVVVDTNAFVRAAFKETLRPTPACWCCEHGVSPSMEGMRYDVKVAG